MTHLRVTTLRGTHPVLDEAAVPAFKQSLCGQLLCPGVDGYHAARQVFNSMIDGPPAHIASWAGLGRRISCVNFARAHQCWWLCVGAAAVSPAMRSASDFCSVALSSSGV